MMKKLSILILFLVASLAASAQYYTTPHTQAYINNIVDSLVRPSVYKAATAANVAELISNSYFNKITDNGGHAIENAGTPLTQRVNLNFNNGLVASDNTPDTDVKWGGTISAATTLTANIPNAVLFSGALTTTADAQYFYGFNPTITGRATAGETFTGILLAPTLVAGANNQILAGYTVNTVFTPGAFTGVTQYIARFRNNGVDRSVITNLGSQQWDIYTAVPAQIGSFQIGSPGGDLGLMFINAAATQRFDIRFAPGGTNALNLYNNTSTTATKVVIGSNAAGWGGTLSIAGGGTSSGINFLTANSAGLTRFTIRDDGAVGISAVALDTYGLNVAWSSTLSSNNMAIIRTAGTVTLQAGSGHEFAKVLHSNVAVTAATNQLLYGWRDLSTYTINHTGAAIGGYSFAPTINGSQTPVHVYAFSSTTGKIGLANYTNGTPINNDFWFESGVPLMYVGGVSYRVPLVSAASGFGVGQIPFGGSTQSVLSVAASFTWNGATLNVPGTIAATGMVAVTSVSTGSNPAISITANQAYTVSKGLIGISPGGGSISIPAITIASLSSTGSVLFTSASAVHVAIGSSNNAYTFNAAGTVFGTHFTMTHAGGVSQPTKVVSQYHDAGFVQWASVLSPAQITSNQNDYNPAGWTNSGAPYGASIVRPSTDASRNITSWAGGFEGRLAIMANVGSFPIVLKHDDGATGTAANRYSLPSAADITVPAGGAWLQFYDDTSDRWRVLSLGSGGSGALSALTAAVGANTIDNAAHTQTWTWNSLAGGKGIELSANTTLATGSNQTLVSIILNGATAAASTTTYGLNVQNAHTSATGTNYAALFSAGGGDANRGVYALAQGNSIGSNEGIRGQATGTGTNNTAIFGYASGTTSNNIGVVGHAQDGSDNISIKASSGRMELSSGVNLRMVGTNPIIEDGSGNELIYFTPQASAVNYLNFYNSAAGQSLQLYAAGSDTNIGIIANTKGSGGFTIQTGSGGFTFIGVTDQMISGNFQATTTYRGSSSNSGTGNATVLLGGAAYNVGNNKGGDAFILGGVGNGTEAIGNVGIGTQNTGINWQAMRGGIFLANAAVVPTGNPTGGSFMYVEAGATKVRGTSGTVTTIGPADPHCPVCGSDFVHEWDSETYGYLAVCMKCFSNAIGTVPYITKDKHAWKTHK